MWIGAFTATHIPNNSIPKAVHDLGKVVLHGVGFFGLSSWFILTLAAFQVPRFRRILIVLFVMMLYAALDEYTQQFFGRTMMFHDWVVDTIATTISMLFWESLFGILLYYKSADPV
jgi:VanZ family protein